MTDLRDISLPTDPDQALAAVVALRRLADRIERQAVRSALRQGWSWSKIAQALGITKQAAHKRLSDVAARDNST
jgi:DNA invertase Pin-like site-specific DNA recombinase